MTHENSVVQDERRASPVPRRLLCTSASHRARRDSMCSRFGDGDGMRQGRMRSVTADSPPDPGGALRLGQVRPVLACACARTFRSWRIGVCCDSFVANEGKRKRVLRTEIPSPPHLIAFDSRTIYRTGGRLRNRDMKKSLELIY